MNFVRAHLIDDTAVAAAVGEAIFPLMVPQGFDKPCIVYQVVDIDRQVTFDGTSGLVAAVVQFDCLAKTYAVARGIADAVRGALVDYRGDMEGTEVAACFITADQDLSDIEPGFFRISLNFNLWYSE